MKIEVIMKGALALQSS